MLPFAALSSLPTAPSLFSRHCSLNCNLRTGRVEKNTTRHKTQHLSRWTDSHRRTAPLTCTNQLQVGFSPWVRGGGSPKRLWTRQPGCSATPCTLGRSYEAGGGAAVGIPPTSSSFCTVHSWDEHRAWDAAPHAFGRNVGEKEGRKREGRGDIYIYLHFVGTK